VYLADLDNRESLTTNEIIYGDNITIALFLILKGEILLKDYLKNNLDNKTIFVTCEDKLCPLAR
jgi:hypothetical protein